LGAVSTLPFLETSNLNNILSEYGIVTVHSVSTDVAFTDGSQYSYKLQTTPVESYQGLVLQSILCKKYGINRVVVFTTTDTFGIDINSLFTNSQYCTIDVVATYSLAIDYYDYEVFTYLFYAHFTQATVYVLFVPPRPAAQILEWGYQYFNLFRSGVEVFGHAGLTGSAMWSHFTDDSLIPTVVKGFVAVEFWPSFTLNRTDEGKKFVEGMKLM